MPKDARGIAWRIECDNDLLVTIAVVGQHILLMSRENSTKAPWRMGYYQSDTEAQRRAVEMTGSYERLRKGKVNEYAEVQLPAIDWNKSMADGTVIDSIGAVILLALRDAADTI
jgi:hypothetical protein